MKKYIPHIILSLVAIAALVFLFTGNNNKDRKKVFDNRITLNRKDKNPYGAYIAYEGLKQLFPAASIYNNSEEPGYWDSISTYDSKQALIIISPRFYPDHNEMKKLLTFVENGNDVFVSTRFLSSEAENFIGSKTSNINVADVLNGTDFKYKDTLAVSLASPPFGDNRSFTYGGQKYNAWIYDLDSSVAVKKGFDEAGQVNFIHLKAGKGNFYLHLSPLCFSNYFLLHHDNLTYYENVVSVISPATHKIVWDEYFIKKKDYYLRSDGDSDSGGDDSDGSLSALFRYKEVKWALLTAILLMLIYVLFEMRRRQRIIPVMAKPKNDSLDFVKTIGRLYYERGDHHNLGRKMASYFLEHVRSRYKIPTSQLNDDFIQKLKFKSGVQEEEITSIVSFINQLNTTTAVTASQVANFHKQLETFYQKA